MAAHQPLIGFGLDEQYRHKYPNGIARLCEQYRSRLSHLSIVSLANVEQAEAFRMNCARGMPIVHHLSGVAPADSDGPHLDRLTQLDRISEALNAAWSCEDIGIWSVGPYAIPYFAPPIFEDEVAALVGQRIRTIIERSLYDYCAEVPACSFVVGRMSLGDFFRRIVDLSGCDIVLDVSHVYSYAIACSQSPMAVLYSLPLDAVREMHVSGGTLSADASNRYLDTHSHPVMDEVLELAAETCRCASRLRCITYEIGNGLSAADIERDASRIEECVAATSWRPTIWPGTP